MSDLIRRKELWEEIARLEELARRRVLDTPISSPCYQRYNAQLNERTNLKHIIADAKTAYDVDKVVEQLESKIEITWSHDYLGGRKDAFNEAIEIVKGGGINE
jgi:hypothetical protein